MNIIEGTDSEPILSIPWRVVLDVAVRAVAIAIGYAGLLIASVTVVEAFTK